MKRAGDRIAMLTAYDYTMARLLDRAGVDVLLVGDSLGMVVLGYDTTVPVTVEAIVHHTRAVSRGSRRAMVVADMPFLSCHTGVDDAVRTAGRLVQEGGAHAVKIEGARPVLDVCKTIVAAGIPVFGHLGLTPQSVHQLGGFRQQARTDEEASELCENARALQFVGACAIVLEAIPDDVAAHVTSMVDIPTIGIGAGPYCDGQVLVSHDAFGLYDDVAPPFVKEFADLGTQMVAAAQDYVREVRDGSFPEARARRSVRSSFRS